MKITFSESCKKWSCVVGLFMISFPQGLPFFWGNLTVYLQSYQVERLDADVTNVQAPWILSLFVAGSCLGFFVSAILSRTFGKRVAMFAASIVYLTSQIAAYFVVSKSIVGTNLIVGIIGASGKFAVDGIVMQYALSWSKERFGFISCLVRSAAPAGAIAMNQIITFWINPDNLSPDKTLGQSRFFSQDVVLDRVPSIFLVMGSTSLLTYIIGVVMVTENTRQEIINDDDGREYIQDSSMNSDKRLRLHGSTDSYQHGVDSTVVSKSLNNSREFENIDRSSSNKHDTILINNIKTDEATSHAINDENDNNESKIINNMTMSQVIRTRDFYAYCAFIVLGEVSFVLMNNYYKSYGQLHIKDDHFITDSSIPLLLFVAFSRPVWGTILDRHGIKKAYVLYFSSCGLTSFLFYFSPMVSKWTYVIATVLFGCVTNVVNDLLAFAVVNTFGDYNFLFIHGATMIPTIVTNFLHPILFAYFLEHFGWFSIYAFGSAVSALSLIIAIVVLRDS